jgi:hypothetical protein
MLQEVTEAKRGKEAHTQTDNTADCRKPTIEQALATATSNEDD